MWRKLIPSRATPWAALTALGLLLIIPHKALCGDITVSNFGGGLDSADNPATLDPSQAADLLNVNFGINGVDVHKRDGYGLFQALPISCSTCAVHGGAHFQQTGGNDVQLWGNDGELAGSVNDGTFVKLATGTVGATWQCADSQGFAYCLDSANDSPVKTDGTSANTSFQLTIPTGTISAFTPTQLLVAGVPGNVSTVYVSQQNNFLNFTIGTLPSSSFTEPIAAPGSRITHLAYYFGKLFWWKDQSFGFATFTSQFDWQLTIVSNQIGTLDNSDAFWNSNGFDSGNQFSGTSGVGGQQSNGVHSPGGIFFRGQDNHLYVYDGYYLTRLSRLISPNVVAANKRKANSWVQTSKSDFQAGSIVPSPNLSTTISPGDVIVSSFQAVENSSTQWTNGTAINTVVGISSITLATNNSGNINDNGFETTYATDWTGAAFSETTQLTGACTVNPSAGSQFADSAPNKPTLPLLHFQILDANSNLLEDDSFACTASCAGWSTVTEGSRTYVGRRVFYQFKADFTGGITLKTNSTYVNGGAVTFDYRCDNSVGGACPGGGTCSVVSFDNILNGSSTITTGSFTSKTYDTGLASATYQINQLTDSIDGTTPTFDIQTSSWSGGNFVEVLPSSATNAVSNEFVRWTSTITIGNNGSVFGTYLSSITILARSTGTYRSAVDNAPNLTSWGTLGITDIQPGVSSITYFTRSATNSFTVNSTTPSWIAQSKNATVASSTGTYFQLRADFYLAAATETPTLNDFTFNWFEGTASDKSYMSYFNDAIWFSVSSSSSASTNNKVFYWDLLNGAWSLYDIAANGFLIENGKLYFGDPVQGRVFLYGSVPTDNGATINSYWKSKDFLGKDPFVQNQYVQADFVLGQSSTTVSYTYTLDSKTSTVFTVTTYDPAASLIQRNFLLPVGKIGKYYNFQFGDNSANAAWRLMGHRVHYDALNWRPVLN